jgi:hypothetical protein
VHAFSRGLPKNFLVAPFSISYKFIARAGLHSFPSELPFEGYFGFHFVKKITKSAVPADSRRSGLWIFH